MEEESKDKSTILGFQEKENFRLESSNNSILDILNHTPERIIRNPQYADGDKNGQFLQQNGHRSLNGHWNGDTSEVKESLQENEDENSRK